MASAMVKAFACYSSTYMPRYGWYRVSIYPSLRMGARIVTQSEIATTLRSKSRSGYMLIPRIADSEIAVVLRFKARSAYMSSLLLYNNAYLQLARLDPLGRNSHPCSSGLPPASMPSATPILRYARWVRLRNISRRSSTLYHLRRLTVTVPS